MTTKDPLSRVWDIIDRASVGMLTTQYAGGLRARPLEARPDREAGLIWFVIDVRGAKDDEVDAAPDVGLAFVDASGGAWLSISGRASIVRDVSKATEIWKDTDNVWLPGGPDDPNMRLLRVEPSIAELWDGPSSAVATAWEFAKARLTGAKPDLGENRKVTVPMT
jgi:general stress protein 26